MILPSVLFYSRQDFYNICSRIVIVRNTPIYIERMELPRGTHVHGIWCPSVMEDVLQRPIIGAVTVPAVTDTLCIMALRKVGVGPRKAAAAPCENRNVPRIVSKVAALYNSAHIYRSVAKNGVLIFSYPKILDYKAIVWPLCKFVLGLTATIHGNERSYQRCYCHKIVFIKNKSIENKSKWYFR